MLDYKVVDPNSGPLSRRLDVSLDGPVLFFESGKNQAAKNEERAPPFIFFAQDTVDL